MVAMPGRIPPSANRWRNRFHPRGTGLPRAFVMRHNAARMLPGRMYLFDDDERERRGREALLRGVCEELVREAFAAGVSSITNPEVRATSSRREFFQWLDADSEPFLVVIDLSSEIDELNFIGARILRAVAEDHALARRCWRVALSKYATAEIAVELQGLAHAIVTCDYVDTQRWLAEAIRSALRQPLDHPTAITQHPATQEPKDWDAALAARVNMLLDAEAMRGDEFIVLNLIKDVPSTIINAELAREREADPQATDRRKSVNDFLHAVIAATGEPTVGAAHERVAQCAPGLRGKTIHEPLTPEAVERAGRTVTDVLPLEEAPARRHRLTDDDLNLANELVRQFSAKVKADDLSSKAGTARHQALRRVLADARFNVDSEVVQYAVWTLSDVIRAEPQGWRIDSVA